MDHSQLFTVVCRCSVRCIFISSFFFLPATFRRCRGPWCGAHFVIKRLSTQIWKWSAQNCSCPEVRTLFLAWLTMPECQTSTNSMYYVLVFLLRPCFATFCFAFDRHICECRWGTLLMVSKSGEIIQQSVVHHRNQFESKGICKYWS